MNKHTDTSKSARHLSLLFLTILLLSWSRGHGQEIIRQINAPGPQARGLAWDGQHLWCADPQNSKVYQLDPADGSILHSFNFTIDLSFGGLAWSPDNTIWLTTNDGQSWFYNINPETGAQISGFHCPGG